MNAIAVDAGTSLIKAVAFDGDGRELAVARRPTRVLHPAPGFAEQDMTEVWAGVAEAVREAAAAVDGDVELIALTAQGDGCWLVDEAGEPVGPATLWNDGRSHGIVEEWDRNGTIERAFRVNGSLTFSGLGNAILHWLRLHDPQRLEQAHKALHCGGWVYAKLTGELAVDESDASAPLLDLRSGTYSQELIELFDLAWAERLLPEVRPMERRVGALTAAAARELGLPAGLPVVMAPYDIASTAIGAGATAAGQACSILGTTICTEVMTDRLETGGEPCGFTIGMGTRDRFLRAYPSLAGTEVVEWAVRLLGLSDPGELMALAERVAPNTGGVLFLPYLAPAGERAPFLDPHARGVFFGLSLEQRPEHVALAVLEGLSFVIRDCLDAAPTAPTELRLCGGGSNSPAWCQLIADVTGLPTTRPADAEPGAKGALITGLVATGAEPSIDAAAARLVALRDRWEPRAERRQSYAERFRQFLELRTACAPAWRRMASSARTGMAG